MNGVEKSRTFLTEFIIVILFFSVSAVILLGVFVKANDKSKTGIILDKCSLITRDLEAKLSFEETELKDNTIEQLVYKKLSDNGFLSNGKTVYVKYFDKDFKETEEKEAVYKAALVVVLDDSNTFSNIISYGIKYTSIDGKKEYYEVSFNKIILGKEE